MSYGGKARSGNYLDVGGNVGAIALPMGAFLSQHGGNVYTVEATPPTAKLLEAGILASDLKNVFVYNYAVGPPGAPDSLTMTIEEGGNDMAASALDGGVGKGNGSYTGAIDPKRRVEYKVPATTLDAMFETEPALSKVLAMKMDIEGYEGFALRGAKKFLAAAPPCLLFMELVPARLERAGTPPDELIKTIAEAGYNTDTLPKPLPWFGEHFVYQKDMAKCVDRVSP